MLAPFLKRLMNAESLSAAEMQDAIGFIMDGSATPAQIAAFLIALRIKRETPEEILGAVQAMRARMQPLKTARSPLVDTCGTGGDGASTFNISTAVAFVVASCDVAVAKHGNRAVSSRSGSADVLLAAGVNVEANNETVERCLDRLGIGFLFAPHRHPAMKHAAPVRKELGVRTMFNILGPLTNPAGAKHQLLGVYDRSWLRPLAEVLGRLGSARAWIVHGNDGLDEITVCDVTHIAEWTGSGIQEHVLAPESVGIQRHGEGSLAGGSPEENATILRAVLAHEANDAINDAVALNAGAALLIANAAADLDEGLAKARASMRAKKPLALLDQLAKLSSQS